MSATTPSIHPVRASGFGQIIASLGCGLLFGVGLTVSQMINPAKVMAFLNLFGDWDPSLAFVMGGALLATTLGYRIVLGRKAPVLASHFQIPTRKDVDVRLIGGAVLFGVGWGLTGLCPGPAIALAGTGLPLALAAAGSIAGGVILHDFMNRTRA